MFFTPDVISTNCFDIFAVTSAYVDCYMQSTRELASFDSTRFPRNRAGNEIMPFPLHKINFVAFARESLGIFPRNQRLLGHANRRVSILLVSRVTERETR